MAKGLDLFPVNDAKVRFRVAERWDMSGDFPLPLWDVNCGECAAHKLSLLDTEGFDDVVTGNVQIRSMNFFQKTTARNRYRCDVHFKCRECSAIWTHGVVLTEMFFKHHVKEQLGVSYDWKAIRSILKPETAHKDPITFETLQAEAAGALGIKGI